MKTILWTICLLSSACLGAAPGHTYERQWTPAKVCEAVTFSYFYLDAVPSYLGEFDNQQRVEIDGQDYDCQLHDDTITLSWLDGSGEPMTSEPILVGIRGNILVIRTNMGEDSFTLRRGRIVTPASTEADRPS